MVENYELKSSSVSQKGSLSKFDHENISDDPENTIGQYEVINSSGGKGNDVGVTSVLSNDSELAADRLKLNKKVVMKIDLVILPFLTCCVFLQILDKNSLSYAAIYDLRTDLNLHGQQYSWLATIFYMSYLFMQFPVFFLLPKIKNLPGFMSLLLVGWGGLVMLLAACKNFAGFATLRFFLGVFEAALQPCCIILSSSWYTKREQPLRMAMWSNTFAGIFNGIFGYAFGHWNAKLHIWQYMFIVYGAVTIVFGLVTYLVVPKDIESAWFLNKKEKECAVARIATNQTGIHIGVDRLEWSQMRESIFDAKYWLIIVFIIVQNFVNSGITNFNTFIIRGFGFSNFRTMLLATPQASVAMVVSLLAAAATYFIKNIRCVLICFTSAVTMTGIIMIWKISPETHRSACLAAIYICGFFNTPYVLALSLFSSNTSGDTKKAFTSFSVGVFYALGNLIGPQFFLNSESPTYQTGIKAMLAACVIMMFCASSYAILCTLENRKRDREHLEDPQNVITSIEIGEEVDRQNLTDVQNRHFRYTI